ncbi:AraC family transcriptional regulator [Puteibacter caeruleilacunae]|nr:AraC family transcriptional regulator [Puteibacter caeruleilacunae]
MQHFKTITEYSKAIGISAPMHPHFDIRSFEENMGTIVHQMPAFRHEFYFIALKLTGDGTHTPAHYTEFPEGESIFFNTPFQIQSWNTKPNWTGYYVIISQDFISSSHLFDRLLDDYSFLKISEAAPFAVGKDDLPALLDIYKKIRTEFLSDNEDKFSFIEVYLLDLLNHIKRLYNKYSNAQEVKEKLRSADLELLSQLNKLLEISFLPGSDIEAEARLHSTSYYANKLSVHPNHLNMIVKNITGRTALHLIHDYIITLAKTELIQTALSIKEIAYNLHFDSPSNFGAFFKKHTGITPLNYRNKR